MQDWFNRLNAWTTVLFCLSINLIGIAFIYLRLNDLIPIGIFVGIFIFIETWIFLYKKYFDKGSNNVNEVQDAQISSEVAEAMASKIKFEAKQHRKMRQDDA